MDPRNKDRFLELMSKVERPGAKEIVDFLVQNGFLTAPASTRFHGSYDGGLLHHSLMVFDTLKDMSDGLKLPLKVESLIICTLLHDVCKTNLYYKVGDKYKSNGGVSLKGHGKQSVEIIKRFMTLTPAEEYAILMHMGIFATFEMGTYIKEYSFKDMNHMFSQSGSFLVYGLHVADMIATHYKEK